jgi:linoleoyl-CoA desaturase
LSELAILDIDPDPSAPPSTTPHLRGVPRELWPTKAEIRKGRRRLHAKGAGIVALVATSYSALVFADIGLVARLGCALVLVVSIVATGTSIMHDANHGAFSSSRRGNQLLAYSGDLIGASSWVWRFKHNVLHHAHTNVVGLDSDIHQAPFARLAPEQAWRPWHRYQHLYIWVLYGLLTLKWFVISDFAALARGGFDQSRFAKHFRRRDAILLALGKVVCLGWAVFVPLLFHPWWGVLAFYLVCSWLVGFVLAMVFQLAHCTDEVEFLAPPAAALDTFDGRQLRTTANIRCRGWITGPFARWLMGGLDHQIEHHLAPRIPHTLYPQMAGRIQQWCAENGITYHVHRSIGSAVRAHARWVKEMGRRPAGAVPSA